MSALPNSLRKLPLLALALALGASLVFLYLRTREAAHQGHTLLLIFSSLLAGLLVCLTVKLVRSHAQVHRMNAQLGQANCGLEQRVEERTAELRAMNSELRAHQALLGSQAQELARARDVAEAADKAKSAFLATMSHELRTPLNAIIGFSELMLTQTFGPLGHPKYAEYINDINKSGAHLLSLINDILDLSRLDAGKAELVEEPFSLPELIADVCRAITPMARQGNLKIVADIAPGFPGLRADQRRMHQILLNLVSNAVKFTPAGGRITLKARQSPDGLLVLQVCDTGIGMSAEELPKALERFGQVDSCLARKYEGTGLGLPLAKQLVEVHDGHFDIQSEPGVGTIVTLTFPAWRAVETAHPMALPLRQADLCLMQ